MKLKPLLMAFMGIMSLSPTLAKETVSLSIDKKAYQIGDTLRFEAKVSSDEPVQSKVIYVDMLSPEGYPVEQLTLKAAGGKTTGYIALKPDNNSGLFEIRAYTRYGLSQNKLNYATQVFPVYEMLNGVKSMKDRWRVMELDSTGARYSFRVQPEQEITLRGKLHNFGSKKARYKDIPIMVMYDHKQEQALTDADGQFSLGLGNLCGNIDMSLAFDFHKLGDNKTCIILDTDFRPYKKPYGDEEKKIIKDYALIKSKKLKNEFHPSLLLSSKEFLNKCLDHQEYLEYFYFEDDDDSGKGDLYMLPCLLDDYGFATEPTRFVRLNDATFDMDSLKKGEFEVADIPFHLPQYQYLYITANKKVCEQFSYKKYNPRTLSSNKLGENVRIVGCCTEAGRDIPGVIAFFVPYPKDTPMSERLSFGLPYVRHVTFHGFSKM